MALLCCVLSGVGFRFGEGEASEDIGILDGLTPSSGLLGTANSSHREAIAVLEDVLAVEVDECKGRATRKMGCRRVRKLQKISRRELCCLRWQSALHVTYTAQSHVSLRSDQHSYNAMASSRNTRQAQDF